MSRHIFCRRDETAKEFFVPKKTDMNSRKVTLAHLPSVPIGGGSVLFSFGLGAEYGY